MDITLYHTPHTRSIRPRWLLEELALPYQIHKIDLFGGEGQSEEYLRINPLGAVPAMKIDGEVVLESGAICHWLADRFPEKALAPAFDDPLRKRYEQWMFFAPGTLEPSPSLVIVHTMILPEPERIESIVPWALDRYSAHLKVLDAALKNSEYLLGKQFSVADIMVGSTLMWLPDSLKLFPGLESYTQRLRERSAYKRATTE